MKWPATSFYWVVSAVALTGCGSDQLVRPSAAPSLLVSPTAPSNTSALAVAYDAIRVGWRDNSTNESGFQILRSTTGSTGTFSLRATRLANATSFQDSGLTPQKSYCYKVRAFRTQDGTRSYSTFSNVACATTPASPKPLAPSGTVAKPVSSTAVGVTWTDKSSNEDGFRIRRSLDAGATWTLAGKVGPNVTTFQDKGRTSEHDVCYRVVAFNEHGTSASNTDCTTPPAAPGNLSASAAAAGGINLLWADNSRTEDGYEIQRSSDGVTFGTIADLGANSTSYNDAGVTANTSLWYRVRAKKEGGFSDFSNVLNLLFPSAPPNAPSNLWAAPRSSTSVAVQWIDNSTNEDGFRVERSTDKGASWTVVATVPWRSDPFSDGGLTSEEEVCYRVSAFNLRGVSEFSNVDCTAAPMAPAPYIDVGTATLVWSDNSNVEDGYEVYFLDGWSIGLQLVAVLPANSTSYQLSLDEIYWREYWVRATNDGGYSDFGRSEWLEPAVSEGSVTPSSLRWRGP